MPLARWTMKWLSAVLVFLALPACAKPQIAALSVDQVEARLGEKGFHVLDCNGVDMYRGAHVPGAKRVDYGSMRASDLPADKEATLVFYCTSEHCHACHKGAVRALQLGYKN